MKKIVKIIYIILFFAICTIPLVAMPFAKSNGEIEKKKLTEMPKIVENGKINTDFSTTYDKWLNEHLPFRAQLLSAANYMKSSVLSSPTANVVSGKDGWYFFQNTVYDYMNTNAMTEQKIQSIAVSLSLMQECVESNGGHFVFSPMPNKNEIYGEYMPVFYKKADENNLSRLYSALDKNDVNYINFVEIFNNNKDEQIYHKKDTHWNYRGAFIGYQSIISALGKEAKKYDETHHIERTWIADMSKLLYPQYNEYDDKVVYDNLKFDEFVFTSPRLELSTEDALALFMSDKEENDSKISTSKKNQTDKSSLYMVRDSFGRALLPYMIDNYDMATFERTNCPAIAWLDEKTDMVYEIGERNLANIVSTAPFMMAPRRTDVKVTETVIYDGNFMITADEGYAFRIYGTVDEKFIGEDSRVYVKLESDKETYIYEAFPIYESKLLENKNTKSDIGFSLMLDTDKITSGKYSISIISNGVSSGVLAEEEIDS